ncbi:MAG: MarC family protein [Rubricoccaceae bacterium]|nr:MarC family protein [Rubricoccaceae bacterium]
MTLVSAFLLLFLVMDPAGNIPLFMAALAPVEPSRRAKVIVRELLVALAVLVLFLFAGPTILNAIGVSEEALSVAGGIILFLIALRMIFPGRGEPSGEDVAGEPFIVPLAIPFLAGPSAMASVMLIMSSDPVRWPVWLLAVLLAWAASGMILLLGNRLSRFFGRRGLIAIERLMGMVLTAIAVEMFLRGLQTFGSI